MDTSNLIAMPSAVKNTNDSKAIVEKVNQMIEDKRISQASISKESGIPKTRLSQFLNGRYPGDNDKVSGELAAWLKSREQKAKALPTIPSFVETTTVRQIWSALQYAQMANCISIIYGNPGVSKTQAIKRYQKDNPNVWLITISPSRASVLECLYEMALELGINNAPRRKGPLSRLITKKLEDSQGLVIIDEADQLQHEALEEIRAIQERAEVGFALVGNHQVYSNLTGGKRDIDFARLFSRIAKKLVIHKVKKRDISDVADAWGLRGKDERVLIEQIASKPGGLRTLFQTLRLAAMVAKGQNQTINAQHIKYAFNDLDGVSQ